MNPFNREASCTNVHVLHAFSFYPILCALLLLGDDGFDPTNNYSSYAHPINHLATWQGGSYTQVGIGVPCKGVVYC